jgi:hypothetical protein
MARTDTDSQARGALHVRPSGAWSWRRPRFPVLPRNHRRMRNSGPREETVPRERQLGLLGSETLPTANALEVRG